MAVGLVPEHRKGGLERFIQKGNLLDGATGTTSGAWQQVSGAYPQSVTFSGWGTATAKLLVSNNASQPADPDNNHPQVGSDVTANTMITLNFPVKYVKVQVSSYVSGTLTAAIWAG